MKTFLVLFLSVLLAVSCQTPANAPKLPRKIKSFVWSQDKQAFCREDDNGIECVLNEELIAYTFDDNTTVLKYIVDLNTQCKKWKKGAKSAGLVIK